MSYRRGATLIAIGACALMAGSAVYAGTKMQGNVMPQNSGGTCGISNNQPCYTLPADKFGKFAIKESKAAGGGGIEMQLNIKGVDCPEGSGDTGKCDAVNNVLELSTNFAGVQTTVGVLFDLDGGKSVFQASGKNKVTGAAVFGALVGAIQGQNLGIGFLRVRGEGTNPADCLVAPLLGLQECNNGEIYGIGGVKVSNEAGTAPPPCTSDANCSSTQDCNMSGACVPETCTADANCDAFTGPGSDVACNEGNSQCCLPNLDTDPACDID